MNMFGGNNIFSMVVRLFATLLLVVVVIICEGRTVSPSLVVRQCCCCEYKSEATYAYLTDCRQLCAEVLGPRDIHANNRTLVTSTQYSRLLRVPMGLPSHTSRSRYCMNTCQNKARHLKSMLYVLQPPPPKLKPTPTPTKQPVNTKGCCSKCMWYKMPNQQCQTDGWSPVRSAIDATMDGYRGVTQLLTSSAELMKPNVKMSMTLVYHDFWRSHCKLWVCLANVREQFFVSDVDSSDHHAHMEHCASLMGYPKLQHALEVLTRTSMNSTYLSAPWNSRFWMLNGIGHMIADMCHPFVQTSRPSQVMKCWVGHGVGEAQIAIWRMFSETLDCTREGLASHRGCDWEYMYTTLHTTVLDTVDRLNRLNWIVTTPCHGVWGVGCADNCVKAYW